MRMAASWFLIRKDQPHTSLQRVYGAGWRAPLGWRIVHLYEQHLPAQCNAAYLPVTFKGKSLRAVREGPTRHARGAPDEPRAEAKQMGATAKRGDGMTERSPRLRLAHKRATGQSRPYGRVSASVPVSGR